MAAYSKLIAAIVGLVILLANQFFGVDLTGLEQPVIDTVSALIAALTAAGVWAVPNVPSGK